MVSSVVILARGDGVLQRPAETMGGIRIEIGALYRLRNLRLFNIKSPAMFLDPGLGERACAVVLDKGGWQ